MFLSIMAVEAYLLSLVPKTSQMLFTGEQGILRTKEYLKLLGSPQNKLKVIHVAGTSGKGSTSFLISTLLISQEFKVGLHLSPHLIDVRERMEINNKLLTEEKFISYFNQVFSAMEKMKNSQYGPITYFEALVGLAFYIFDTEKVDYCVMETGLGGLYDGTNIVERQDKLSVLTKIGLDHTKVLGNTIQKITNQKAYICAEQGELISISQTTSAQKEIKKVVNSQNGVLYIVNKKSVLHEFGKLEMGLKGEYQKENSALALTVFSHLSKRDQFEIQMDSLKKCLKEARFKGRFDVVEKKNSILLLDGAHNPQKMKALLTSVHAVYPGKKFTFVIGFKQGKDYKKMLEYIIPFANKIIITHIFSEHQDLLHMSVQPKEIKKTLQTLDFKSTQIVQDFDRLMQIVNDLDEDIIVTGSLYLLGDIYKRLSRFCHS
jgi:dihydrofolate synthase/folylpolyglutamate synthase